MKTHEPRITAPACACVKLLVASCLALGALQPAQAAWWDTLFGQGTAPAAVPNADKAQRVWRISEFSRVELVPREAGAADNQHPVQLQAGALRQQLAQVETDLQGKAQPLFAADELADIVEPLLQAFAQARPGDDVLLISTSRRGGGVLAAPTAVTARLFVQGGGLQLIVHDARFDFYDVYRGTQVLPRFAYGSRATPGASPLHSAAAANRRSDWLAIPLAAAVAGAVPAPPAQPVPALMPAAAPMPAVSAAAPPAAPPAAPRKPPDSTGAEDIERRLETLKRLRERGLVSEDEYQQKRKEILQQL
jgi:hypothetical protein